MIRQSRPTVLITRPMAQSLRFGAMIAQRFRDLPHIISPLLAPRFLGFVPKTAHYAAVIFTSETGVAGAVRAGFAAQTAYCVGGRTAVAARAAGYVARSAEGDWRDLAALICAERPAGPLLFLCAQEAPAHLENVLRQAGFDVQRANIYAQDPQPFTPEARALLAQDQPVLAVLFSPRSAQLFCTAARGCAAPLWVAAFSDNVAAEVTLPHAAIRVAHRPNSAAMLDAVAALLENSPAGRPDP